MAISSGSSAQEHEIDRMVVRLVGNQEDYQKMLKDVEQQTEKSAKWAEEQGGKITNAFSKAFRSAQGAISSTGSGLGEIGQAMRQPADQQKQVLGKAALDFSEYGKSIKDMVRESEKAGKEAEELMKRTVKGTEAYKELEKIIKLNTEEMQVFKLMSERTGISVGELSKTIKVGSEEYEKWRKETERFGLMFDDESLKKADELAESWQRVRQAMQGMWAQIGNVVAERFKELNERIEGIVTWVIKWIKENKDLIASSVELAAKIGAVGTALTILGTAISTVGALLGPITVMIGAGVAAWTLWNKESEQAMNTDLLDKYTENFKGLYNQVVTYGKQITDHVSKTMDGVFNAIKAGNLELAVKIVWTSAKVLWIRSMKEINDLTGEHFGGIFNNLATGEWKAALEALWIEVKIIWTKGLLEMAPLWSLMVDAADTTWTAIQTGWNTLVDNIKKGINEITVGLHTLLNNIVQNSPMLANRLGITGLAESVAAMPLLQRSGGANDDLNSGLEQRRSQREDELLLDQILLGSQLGDLEAQREGLDPGNEAAEETLEAQRDILENLLEQAEAERELIDLERARAREAQQLHDTQEEIDKKRLQRERDRQHIEERWDPVERYRRQLKELNAFYEEAERGSITYRRELENMQDELAAGLFALEAQFGNVGFDAVEKGTRGHQELLKSSLAQGEMERARRMGVGEAEEREAEAEEREGEDGQVNAINALHEFMSGPLLQVNERAANAAEKTAEKPSINLDPLGIL